MDSHLRLGIRSKEFNKEGSLSYDATPFDTDFSEITSDNLNEKTNISDIINSTYSAGYGRTYYVVKKENYEEEKSYTMGSGSKKTRYIRTATGSNNISAIITTEWQEKYGYVMAQNGIYIPVYDKESGKLLFTEKQYDEIRENMKGLSYYKADDFEIDQTAINSSVLEQAKKLKEQKQGETTTKEKQQKIIELIKNNLVPKIIVADMVGDLSKEIVEFIDTGSTGRGTNLPGDGDFDFMLKCLNKDEQVELIAKIKTFLKGKDKGGTNDFNIRYEDVKIDGLEETVDIDITSEAKSLDLEYSSDLCVRDRLAGIKKVYGQEGARQVVDNIIVAKKRLKELRLYKKTGSTGSTEYGGFGGIGVENWILQNGGSFILAMQTFLDNAIKENGEEENFEEFKRKYPIYDFGCNHREQTRNDGHDHFIEGLTPKGYSEMIIRFKELLLEYGVEYTYKKEGHKIEKISSEKECDDVGEWLYTSIVEDAKNPNYKISDMSRIYAYVAKLKGREELAKGISK